MKERALLLSGGAFRGAVQIPVIERLFEEFEYDAVYGVSVGSINGVMFSQHELYELRKFWDDINGVGGFLKLKWYWPFNGLYSMRPLRKKLEANVDLGKIKTPFAAGIVSGTTGEYLNISTLEMTKNEQLWDAIQSSSCIAGVMTPGTFIYDNVEHIGFDGGYRSIIPIPHEDFKILDVVTCTPLDRMKMKVEFQKRDILSLATRGIEIFEDEVFDKNLLTLQNSKAEKITVYSPQEYPGAALDASSEMIRFRYKLGEEAYYKPFKLK